MPKNNQIILVLKEKIKSLTALGRTDAETLRNVLKEELQYYILNFIYHHTEYADWIMYGGSALRICHNLDRMSVDLDFEIDHKISDLFLDELKKEIENYFKNTYNLDSEVLTIKTTTDRGLRLCFQIGDLVGLDIHSKQVIVKIDLNNFAAPKTTTERIPINRNQMSFVIKTYNMSSLMASKIAAILLRGKRGGLGGIIYEEKGRDIYDLLWYMNKKIVPDLDYLNAKNIGIKDLRSLFAKLTLQMNKVNNKNLKDDLTPLFVDATYIENWLENWLESYFRLLEGYKINTVTTLNSITISQDFSTENFNFTYQYNTESMFFVNVTCALSDYWIDFRDGDMSILGNNKISDMVKFTSNISGKPAPQQKKLKQYATLFYQKIEKYLEKSNHIILGDSIVTKVVRMTANNLNQKEQIVLDKSTLLSCELEDLLK